MKTIAPLLLVLLCIAGYAQKNRALQVVPKKPISHADYDNWKDITYKGLTPDGAHAVFVINPQDGDGKAIFHNLKTKAKDSIARAAEMALAFDSRVAAFKIKPPQQLVKDLRKQKKKKEELPKDSLGMFDFISRKTTKIADVKSFQMPTKAGGWVAYQLEAPKEEKPKADAPKSKKKVKKNTDDNGYTLVLRKTADGKETRFGYVKEYTFAKYGQGLMFTSTGNDSTLKAGVFWYDLKTETLKPVLEGKSKFKYKSLAISEDGTRTAFLVDFDTTKAQVRHFQLMYWKTDATAPAQFDLEKALAIPANTIVGEHFAPRFSQDGQKLLFGIAPVPMVADTTLLPEESVQVEIWASNDPAIYPQQKVQLETERKRSYLSFVDVSGDRFNVTNLGSKEIPTVEIGQEGNASVALGKSDVPYRKSTTWNLSGSQDVYLFDLNRNTQRQIARKITGNAALSPQAKYVYWFNQPDTAWFACAVGGTEATNISKAIQFSMADEEDDHPDYPNSYGMAGWTKDDQLMLVYDRFDVWAIDPTGKATPVNLTGIGRQERTRFRYLRLNPDEKFINPDGEIFLSAFNELTKASGFYKLSLKTRQLTKLVVENARFEGLSKSLIANQFLYTRESFAEFPDVWSTDFTTAAKKITNANPQQKNFLWGTVETVRWNSTDNIPLEGLLYKPEGFDSKKKYPMIVYFYEKNSDQLYTHRQPLPNRSSIVPTTYVSNGYLVFVPDIVYKVGYPGESAMNSVMPGVTALIAKGFVDEKNIGVQGHSWGGYQIAYMVTRTNLFKAAEAGAPVANMISAYGGIRWESGLSRMFQYEHDQSRIGGTLWEKPMNFIENSPIFFADKIQTPLLLMANDNDGAVPWYQGIEFYMALRRLEKPVWMLNYNGEPHGLTKRENRIDFHKRLMQYFDHYLKGAPAPEWMTKGVPAIQKGINKGY